MAAPTVRAVGTTAGGIGAISPGLPAGTAAGDLLLDFLETQGGSAITASGWTELPVQSPKDTGATSSHSRLTILYKIAVGGDATTTSDSGDHQVGQIVGIIAGTFDAVTPFNGAGGGDFDAVGSTTPSIPGGTTTVAECLVFAAITFATVQNSYTNVTNASLASVDARINAATTLGHDGAVAAWSGVKTVAGAYNATTLTVDPGTVNARISFAVAPFGGVTTPLTLSATQGQTPLIPRQISKVLVA